MERQPIYLRITPNKVINIAKYDEIRWGQYRQIPGEYWMEGYGATNDSYRFADIDYARRFAAYFYGVRCGESDRSVEVYLDA